MKVNIETTVRILKNKSGKYVAEVTTETTCPNCGKLILKEVKVQELTPVQVDKVEKANALMSVLF